MKLIKKSNKHEITATPLGVQNIKRANTSHQIDPWEGWAANSPTGQLVITPPYDPSTLSGLFEQSNLLRQCVEVMAVNICQFGHRIVPIDTDIDPVEQRILQDFIDSPNLDESLSGLCHKIITDYERYGYAFVEVIRNKRGYPTMLKHAKSALTRISPLSIDIFPVESDIIRGGKKTRVIEYRAFRRYVQHSQGRFSYFKEFGDPRDMDWRTGVYSGERQNQIGLLAGIAVPDLTIPDTTKDILPEAFRATEILHYRQYSEDSYGIPRWINQLPNILGSREAEEVNLRYFQENTVPPMVLLVAGGRLTKQSFLDIQGMLNREGVGIERQNKIILLEAVPDTMGVDDGGNVRLQVEKLTDARPSDGLFADYDKANMAKLRSAFRIPPVLLGLSEDSTNANAGASVYIAETQVFVPERRKLDEFLNKHFVNNLNGLNLKTVKLETKSPPITNPDEIIRVLTSLNVIGGVTPRSSIEIANETMQLTLPKYPEKGTEGYQDWMDMPISLSQRAMISKTQQTGEGNNGVMQPLVPNHVDKVQETGNIKPPVPAHGQEGIPNVGN